MKNKIHTDYLQYLKRYDKLSRECSPSSPLKWPAEFYCNDITCKCKEKRKKGTQHSMLQQMPTTSLALVAALKAPPTFLGMQKCKGKMKK